MENRMGQGRRTVSTETLNDSNKDLYTNIYSILTTVPVFSASSERSLSAIRRIKRFLQAIMRDGSETFIISEQYGNAH